MASKNIIETPVTIKYDPSKVVEGFKPNKSLEIFESEGFTKIGGSVKQAIFGSKSALLKSTADVVDFELIEDIRLLRQGKTASMFSAVRFYPAEIRTNANGDKYKLSARACFFVAATAKEMIEVHQDPSLIIEDDETSVGNVMMYFTLNNSLALFVSVMNSAESGKKSVKNFIPWLADSELKTRTQKSMVALSRAFLNMVNSEEEVDNI